MLLKLLGYAPDQDPTVLGVITGASAVVPSLRGMKGAPSAVAGPLTTLAATCQGCAALTKLDASTRLFAGAPTKLYESASTVWTDVSRAAAYTIAATDRWRFAQFGNVSLASNVNDTVQASVSTGAFSDVAGAPSAAVIETVGQFVFAFNTNDTTYGASPDRWWCAGIGGYTSWTPAVATQATTGRLTSAPGPITGARRFGPAIVVYKRDSMYLGTYYGPPSAWNFDQIPGKIGALSQEAIANIGTPENPKHIFMGVDNFYLFDGSKPVPLGTNKLANSVFGSLLQSRDYTSWALHDAKNYRVYFFYPVADSIWPDHCVVYNYKTDEWGVDDRQIQAAVEYVTPGVTYDALGSSYATYNDLPAQSYDNAFLSKSLAVPAVFDTAGLLRTLTGVTGNSSFTTGDFGADEEVLSVNRIRPRFLTAPTSATWTHGYRMNVGDALTNDAAVALASGKFDFVRDARWHRGTLALVGNWELSVLDIETQEAGSE